MIKVKWADITDRLDKLLAEMPVPDLLILAGGAYAGSMGYTPMTALMGGNATIDKLQTDVLQGIALLGPAGIELAALGPLGFLTFILIGTTIPDEEQDKTKKDVITKQLALACIGMIEAYAITRPGVLTALIEAAGSAVQGLGKGLGGAALGAV